MVTLVFLFLIRHNSSVVYTPQRLDWSVTVRDLPVDLNLFSVFLNPKGEVTFSCAAPNTLQIAVEGCGIKRLSPAKVMVQGPAQPGHYRGEVSLLDRPGKMQLNVFVLTPFDGKQEQVGGYRLGKYPDKPLKNLDIYKPPKGFFMLTPEQENIPISPHFTLGQFICKQSSGYPKAVMVREALLLKLESLLERANQKGYHCTTLTVMSGFRTPHYNRSIGNVAYSRHQWGGAADVYIDVAPRDGNMDDLNGDGKIDQADAQILADLVEQLERERACTIGGLGLYSANSSHGPFVHVDVRGFRARWNK